MTPHSVQIQINNVPLSIETGKVAKQADGSVVVPEALRPYMGGQERIAPAA